MRSKKKRAEYHFPCKDNEQNVYNPESNLGELFVLLYDIVERLDAEDSDHEFVKDIKSN